MKAIQFQDSIPSYVISKALGPVYKPVFYGPLSCIRYRDVPEPLLPGDDWARVKLRYAGICGSDLNMIRLHDSPAMSSLASFPFTIGHENVGRLIEVGDALEGFKIGDRVVADPVLPCPTRGISPVCPHCADLEYSRCLNYAEGDIAPGPITGACRDTGGSWSPQFVAHRHQLFHVPDGVNDENAILVDAFCSALHPVMRNTPRDEDTVLVLGAGVIGICVVAALRALGSHSRILVVAKYPFQGELAQHYGADEIIYLRDGDVYEAVAERTGARLYKPILGKRMMMGGADVVFECVGSDSSVDDALRFAGEGGKVVLVGLTGVAKGIDWTPIWFHELEVTGCFAYSTETYQGKPIRTYQLALDWLAEGRLDLTPLLTHRFKLENYRDALHTLMMRKSSNKAIKAVFEFD
ncbi:MAG: zinc-binding dehydrogenase [Anaerolineales bacterium]|nr:zinc-binding dehydrogenase [Anaerolineales bacterium]